MAKVFKSVIEITKESGEVIKSKEFFSELEAQNLFDKLVLVRHPETWEGLTMNLSEYPENRIGSVRLIVNNRYGSFERREMYRKP